MNSHRRRHQAKRNFLNFVPLVKQKEQISCQAEKIKHADHVIENKGRPGELFESVEKFYIKIKKEFLTIKS